MRSQNLSVPQYVARKYSKCLAVCVLPVLVFCYFIRIFCRANHSPSKPGGGSAGNYKADACFTKNKHQKQQTRSTGNILMHGVIFGPFWGPRKTDTPKNRNRGEASIPFKLTVSNFEETPMQTLQFAQKRTLGEPYF